MNLGFAAFITAVFLLSSPARADLIVHNDFAASLNQNNIRAFLEQAEQMANGQGDMTLEDMTAWFDNHLAEDGRFATTLHYEMPGRPAKDTSISLNKPQYIEGIVGGRDTMQNYSSTLDIQAVDISANGKRATLKTVTHERGKLSIPNEQAGGADLVPVQGQSACDQVLIISESNYIQMQKAECKTSMKIDPWDGQPLEQP